MKTPQSKLNRKVKLVIVTLVLIFGLSCIPAAAFELAMATGDKAPAAKMALSVAKIKNKNQIQTLSSNIPKREMKDIFIIPQP